MHEGAQLVFVQTNTPTVGLPEGTADVGVLRWPVHDPRLRTAVVWSDGRYAAVQADDPLARRRSLRLADMSGRTVALDPVTGTTTDRLWPPDGAPGSIRRVRGVDEWLTAIAAGQALGLTAAATVSQHPRPGVVYRPVRDAPPVPVLLAWRAENPPALLPSLLRLVAEAYGSDSQGAHSSDGQTPGSPHASEGARHA
jgi:hypothetical protein